jgi:hypothetical protein
MPKVNYRDAYYRDLKKLGTFKGWAFHHFSYRHLKRRGSIVWIDGLYLPRWLHIYVVHLFLGWGLRASTQRLGKFPNILQRTAHWILRVIMPVIYLMR